MLNITLLSDFGLRDASVAIAKAVILNNIPDACIIDITHDIKPFQTYEAAYIFSTAYKHFPKNTIHLILFDIFAEKEHQTILTQINDQYIISSDNNLIPIALNNVDYQSWNYSNPQNIISYIDWLSQCCYLINSLQENIFNLKSLQPIKLKNKLSFSNNINNNNEIEIQPIYIDTYENIVLNITKLEFENLVNGKNFELKFKEIESIHKISENFNELREGDELCRFNANNYLEIAIKKGKAASLFGIKLGGINNNIKLIIHDNKDSTNDIFRR